jgi:hypothetical protein
MLSRSALQPFPGFTGAAEPGVRHGQKIGGVGGGSPGRACIRTLEELIGLGELQDSLRVAMRPVEQRTQRLKLRGGLWTVGLPSPRARELPVQC